MSLRRARRPATRAAALLGLAAAAGCSLVWLAPPPTESEVAGIRIGLEDRDDTMLLVIRRRDGDTETAVAARSVRLVLGDGQVHELPFVTQLIDGNRLTVPCGPAPDHTVELQITASEHGASVTITDAVELPSQIAELSIEYELLAAEATSPRDRESFAPMREAPDQIAGDNSWRMPAAFVRSGRHALAVLPDTTSAQARTLPGALELTATGPQRIRHGLLAQHQSTPQGWLQGTRAPELRAPVAGQTLSVRHELQLFTAAEPRQTLRSVASAVWSRSIAQYGRSLLRPVTPRAMPILQSRPDVPLRPDQASLWSYGARLNANLVAAALTASTEPADRDAGRALLDLANSAPQRSGLSPTVLQVRPGNQRQWRQPDQRAPVYDATANAWTRTTGLWAARHLASDDPVRTKSEQAAAALAAFLLDNQRQSGAIPAHFDTTYLAPIRDELFDPAPESGAAALLLAEVGAGVGDLAQRARAGAIAALLYLQREVAPDGAWFDCETLAGPVQTRPRGTLALTLAALAAFRVLDFGEHADVRATARVLLDELIRHQQAWSPPWLNQDPTVPSLFGGFGCHEADPRWSDPRQAVIALAMLRGYDHFGERELLERGAHAVQAALAVASPTDSEHAALGPAGTAAATALLVLAGWGHAVVDLQAGFCESIDGPQLTVTTPLQNQLRLTMQTAFPDAVAEQVMFRGVAKDSVFELFCNDNRIGEFDGLALRRGIALRPEHVPTIELAPPTTVQLDQAFWPRVLLGSEAPEGFSGEIEFATADPSRGVWRRPLQATEDPLVWSTKEALVPSTVGALSSQITATAVLRGATGTLRTLTANLQIGNETVLAVAGRDDVDCLSRATSRRVLFADGLRLARTTVQADQPLRWRLAVDPGTTGLEVDVLLAGRVLLTAEDLQLHEDPAEVGTGPRTLHLALRDRRLWESGTLTLSFANADTSGTHHLQVAELRVQAAAATAAPDLGLGARTRRRAPDPRLQVLVVPVALADAPLRYSRDQLDTMMFGEAYADTPEPQPRATSGSVRQVIGTASGGQTLLVGEVAEPLTSPLSAAELRADPEQLARLMELVGSAFAKAKQRPQLVVVIHGGTRLPEPPRPSKVAGLPDDVPVLLLGEQAADRSALATAEVAAAMLRARYGLQPVDTPANGNFGALALAGSPDQHLAPSPLGVDLAWLGWADLVDVGTDGARELSSGPLAIDRRVFRLTSGVAGRGDLYVEARGGVAADAGLPVAGLLAYWQLRDTPLVHNLAGQSVRPSRLRLARNLGLTLAPFQAGRAEELLQRTALLDDSSVPSMATPQGELFFRLRDVAVAPNDSDSAPPQLGMVVEPLVRDLLAEPPTPAIGIGAAWTPLPTDAVDRGLGMADLRPGTLRVQARQHSVRLAWPGRSVDGRANRLFGRARLTGGPVRVRVGQDDAIALDAVWRDPSRELACVVDLFAPRGPDARLWLELTATSPAPATLDFEQLLTVPRARPDHTPLRFDRLHSAQLSDGKVHAPLAMLVAGADGSGQVVEPTLLPARRTMLRLRCGFAETAPPDTSARLRVALRSFDGQTPERVLLDDATLRRGEGEQPILTALLQIPKVEQPLTAMLSIRIVAAPGTTLWLAAVEVTRP